MDAGGGSLRRILSVIAISAWLASAAPAAAVPNDTDGDGPTEGPCLLSAYDFALEGQLVVVGIPVTGTAVQITGASAKLAGTKATAARICEPVLFAVSSARWSVVSAPPGQSASISNGTSLTPTVALGGPGPYRFRLTACPNGCRVTLAGRSRTVGPFTRDVSITVVDQFAPPPETEPLLPPLSGPATPFPRFTDAQRSALCLGGGGVQDPQWVTAEPFAGPESYRLLEGKVEKSKVARQDNFLNHDSQDQNWDVAPDPPYFGLPHPIPNRPMEMELETNHLPRELRPTAGDRAGTFGYWIFDCGHDPFRAEIHPSVGLATSRARAVTIPTTFRPPGFPNGFGANVQTPGISTDIWFTRRSGEITNNCSDTGLHQPPRTVQGPGGSMVRVPGRCVREPHDLGRVTFNVYLPRDPRQRAQEAGISNPPPVPLFVGPPGRLAAGPGGPDPTVVVRQQNGISWLEVTVDLTSFTGDTYARRIAAAWAYPNPDNWGAKRWRVRLKTMNVFDDAEPPGDDGDWRVFFNTNNRDREWTKFIDCDGCIDDDDDRTINLQTGGSGLGADPVVFPGQRIFVHTSGFDDETFGDDIGTVFVRETQRAGDFSALSVGGDGEYRLNYSLREGPAIGPAALTPEARALIDAYTVRGRGDCRPVATQGQAVRPRDEVAFPCRTVAPAKRDPAFEQDWHPDNVILRSRVRSGEEFELFEGEREEFALTGISATTFRRVYREASPAERRRLLAEIRAELSRVPRALRRDYGEVAEMLDDAVSERAERQALPPAIRRATARR